MTIEEVEKKLKESGTNSKKYIFDRLNVEEEIIEFITSCIKKKEISLKNLYMIRRELNKTISERQITDAYEEKDTKIEEIIKNYGVEKQKIKAVEELSELQKEICKNILKGGNFDNIIEEIADVTLMLSQLKIIYKISDEIIKDIVDYKIDRTIKRIKNE